MKLEYRHTFSAGHRLHLHGGKCRNLHGHNFVVILTLDGAHGDDGMVMDFAIIKERICKRLDELFDHKLLIYRGDPLAVPLSDFPGVRLVEFIPTAEGLAKFIKEFPWILPNGVGLISVQVHETEKCCAVA